MVLDHFDHILLFLGIHFIKERERQHCLHTEPRVIIILLFMFIVQRINAEDQAEKKINTSRWPFVDSQEY